MTDNEIIKALEYCAQQGITSECERCEVKKGCRSELIVNALDLITRQKAEIERLKAPTTDWLVKGFSKKELERIKIEALKAEAIKEFAKRLCEDRLPNDPVVIAVKTELKMMQRNGG